MGAQRTRPGWHTGFLCPGNFLSPCHLSVTAPDEQPFSLGYIQAEYGAVGAKA